MLSVGGRRARHRLICFKQKTAYEMRIRDWSSDVCSSDLFTDADRIWNRTVVRCRPRMMPISSFVFPAAAQRDRKSVVLGKRVAVRVDHGGRRLITNTIQRHTNHAHIHCMDVLYAECVSP